MSFASFGFGCGGRHASSEAFKRSRNVANETSPFFLSLSIFFFFAHLILSSLPSCWDPENVVSFDRCSKPLLSFFKDCGDCPFLRSNLHKKPFSPSFWASEMTNSRSAYILRNKIFAAVPQRKLSLVDVLEGSVRSLDRTFRYQSIFSPCWKENRLKIRIVSLNAQRELWNNCKSSQTTRKRPVPAVAEQIFECAVAAHNYAEQWGTRGRQEASRLTLVWKSSTRKCRIYMWLRSFALPRVAVQHLLHLKQDEVWKRITEKHTCTWKCHFSFLQYATRYKPSQDSHADSSRVVSFHPKFIFYHVKKVKERWLLTE